jgi:hypothetical protein
MDLGEIGWERGCGVDSPGSGFGAVAGCCECGDEPSDSAATIILHQRPLNIIYDILSLINNIILTADTILLCKKNLSLTDDPHSPVHRKMYNPLLVGVSRSCFETN